jgi:hypothetical protein
MSRARADLTIVQKIDSTGGSAGGELTLRIKGDKARIDASPQVSAIVDGKTGEIITLMKDQKRAVRISAHKMKAAAEMLNKFNDKKTAPTSIKPKPTGRKETINGYEAEEYSMETPRFKASFWLVPKFPNGDLILKQLQATKWEAWNSANPNMPGYGDLPALPIRTVVDLGNSKMTTTLVSAKLDPVSEEEFVIPKDFQEIKTPELGGMLRPEKEETGAGVSPHP